MIITCAFLTLLRIFVFQVGKSIMLMIKTNEIRSLDTYMQALCKSSFDNDGSTTLLSCAICGVWEKEGRHVCHMPISLRVNTSTATRQNVGQEHTVFFYFTAAESYFQKLSKKFSTNFAETANNHGHLSRKSFCLTLERSNDNYSVFGSWKCLDQKDGNIWGDDPTSSNTNLF